MQLVLESIAINRIRCFEEISLSFNGPRRGGDGWTVLVGVNGVGKSTVLQSIVLGVLDPRPVTSLIEAPWRLYRSGDPVHEHGAVVVGFDGDLHERRVFGEEGRYIDAPQRDALWGSRQPLILAFSARRRIARPGEVFEAENLQLHRVQGMFRNDHPLVTQDPFAVLEDDTSRRAFAAAVRDVVATKLDDGTQMFPLVDVVELRGQGGVDRYERLMRGRRFELRYGADYTVRVAIEELSDGYQAMLALILEIMSQAAIATRTVPDPGRLEALILVDELESHLHPSWQRTVMPLLRAAFPRCQFVVTTHSPLVVASAYAGEVNVLRIGDDGAVYSEVIQRRLAMEDAEQIYEEVFEVDRMAPPDVVAKERQYLHEIASGSDVDPELENFVESAWDQALRDK